MKTNINSAVIYQSPFPPLEGGSGGDIDNFTKHFGWLYNAKMVADFEGIPVESVWGLKVIHFLNDLLYLKLKLENEHRQKSN